MLYTGLTHAQLIWQEYTAKSTSPVFLWKRGAHGGQHMIDFYYLFFGTCCTNDTHWFIWLNHEEVASDKHFERCYRFKKPQCISISHSQSHYITEQAIFLLSYCSILPDLPSLLVSPSVIAHLLSEHWLYVGAGQLIAQEDKNWTEIIEPK